MTALHESGAEIHVGNCRSVRKCAIVVTDDGELGQRSRSRDPSVVLAHPCAPRARPLLHQSSARAVLVVKSNDPREAKQFAFDRRRVARALDQFGKRDNRDAKLGCTWQSGPESSRRSDRAIGYLVEVVDQERGIEEVISQGKCAAGGYPNSALPTLRRRRPSEFHGRGSTPSAGRLGTHPAGGPWRRTSSSPVRPDGR